jgi:hypothetical protein
MEYESPGRYTINIPISPPESFSVVVGMYNDHGQYFEDVVSVRRNLPLGLNTRVISLL